MCMGPPYSGGTISVGSGVYPHVYGATSMTLSASSSHWGLSPCVWGHLVIDVGAIDKRGSIPMCMGPPYFPGYARSAYWVYPHVYGATRDVPSLPILRLGVSTCVC